MTPPSPEVGPLPDRTVAAVAPSEWDGGWRTATARGNRGGGIAIALLDPTFPDGRHVAQMHDMIGEVVPDVGVYRAAADPAEVYRLCPPPFGCSVVCCPWQIREPGPLWDKAFKWAAANGVLVIQGAGNGVDPFLSPDTVAAAGLNGDGSLRADSSPPTGRIDAAAYVGNMGSSGATARLAAIAVQWLAAGGVYLFGRPHSRLPGFRAWLRENGTPVPGGRGVVPFGDSL